MSTPRGRFMPRVEIVQKHNTAARRLYIRGHNGKIYPYLVMNDACLTESRREERVLQLLRLLNPCLEKRKETTKRHLFFTGIPARPRGCTATPGTGSLCRLCQQLRVSEPRQVGAGGRLRAGACRGPAPGGRGHLHPWGLRLLPAGRAPNEDLSGEGGPGPVHTALLTSPGIFPGSGDAQPR